MFLHVLNELPLLLLRKKRIRDLEKIRVAIVDQEGTAASKSADTARFDCGHCYQIEEGGGGGEAQGEGEGEITAAAGDGPVAAQDCKAAQDLRRALAGSELKGLRAGAVCMSTAAISMRATTPCSLLLPPQSQPQRRRGRLAPLGCEIISLIFARTVWGTAVPSPFLHLIQLLSLLPPSLKQEHQDGLPVHYQLRLFRSPQVRGLHPPTNVAVLISE